MRDLTRRRAGVLLAGAGLAAGGAGPLWAEQTSGGGMSAMRSAAGALLAGAGSASREKLAFPFAASERYRWRYVPGLRPGLALGEMTGAERERALALLRSSLSRAGYAKATGVIALADELRRSGGSGAYAFAVFGDPEAGGAWGWRIEGHHLSLNFTALDDRLLSATPHCVCVDPEEVTRGAQAGFRPLDREDYIARDLARQLSEAQMALARRPGSRPRDVVAGPGRAQTPEEPAGIGFGELNGETQHHLMLGIAEAYLGNLPFDLAKREMAKLAEAGHEGLRFQWAGGLEASDLRYYRLQGPGLLIEYSTRERASHIHSLWREPGNDFGRAALAAAGLGNLPPANA